MEAAELEKTIRRLKKDIAAMESMQSGSAERSLSSSHSNSRVASRGSDRGHSRGTNRSSVGVFVVMEVF
jgi:hypothetical protein